MKKTMILIVAIICMAGCGRINYEEEIKTVAINYYNDNVKGKITGMDKIEVSVDTLRDLDDYDVSKLKKCTDESKVTLVLDKKGQITDYIYDLNCK